MTKLIFTSAFLAIFFLFLKPPTDPDLFWHLRYGEEILKTGQIPYADRFSFTLPGYQWANSYWLSEVFIYLLIKKLGFFFPALLFAFLGAASLLMVGFGASLKKVSSSSVSFAAFWGALISWEILGLRPQTISLFLAGVVLLILTQFWLGKRPKVIFLLPLVFIFWANLHAGFTLGLAFIWLFWAAEAGRILVEKFRKAKQVRPPFLNLHQLKTLASINLLSSLVTLINPYGFGLWRTILNDASSSEIKNQIAEWLPLNFRSEIGLLLILYLLVLLLLFWRNKSQPHPTRLLTILVFFLLTIASIRQLPVLVLLLTPLLAEELRPLPWEKINFSYRKLALVLFFLLFALVWGGEILPQTYRASRSVKDLAQAGIDSSYQYPYQAVEYLKKHPQERMFNDYGWGGFLLWQLPQNKTFIDGRMPGWKKEDREILKDFITIMDLKKDFNETLEIWQIQAFLIRSDASLVRYLELHPRWAKVYSDDLATVFTQKPKGQ